MLPQSMRLTQSDSISRNQERTQIYTVSKYEADTKLNEYSISRNQVSTLISMVSQFEYFTALLKRTSKVKVYGF